MISLLLVLSAWILVPVAVSFARYSPPQYTWSTAPNHSSGLAPDPRVHREAVVQIYLARAFSWRGIFAIHPWIIVKPSGATSYTRYEVVGWGNGPKLRTNYAAADALWYGAEPELLLDLRGPGVDALIDRIRAAVASYPFKDVYRT